MTGAGGSWQKLLRLAVAKHQQGALAEAIALYRTVLAEQPELADALHLLGVALEQSGNAAEGLPFVERAIVLEPAVSAYRNSLGNIHKALTDPVAAQAAYAEALRLDPRNAEAYNNQGLMLQADGDWAGAIRHFTAALDADPAYLAARFNLATTNWLSGQRDVATAQFRAVLQVEPSYAWQVASLARRSIADKDAAAAHWLVDLISRHPLSTIEWLSLRAGLALVDGDLPAAEQAYGTILAIAPDHKDALMILGQLLIDRGVYAEALPVVERAQALQPDNHRLLVMLGFVLTRAGQVEKAVDVLQQAAIHLPGELGVWTDLAQNLSKLLRNEEAVAAYRKALQLAPDNAEILANLAGAEIKVGDYDAAEAASRAALAIDPKSRAARGNLANVYDLRKQFAQAEEIYLDMLADAPEDGTSHNNLAIMLLRQGRYAEAWPHFVWRWKSSGWTTPDSSRGLLAWDGRGAVQGRLLIWREQGVGDEILYASMLPDLIAAGHDIVLATDRRLVPLFRRSFPALDVIDNAGPVDPVALGLTCQRPFGDLGSILRPDAAAMARQPSGYLVPDPDLRERLRHRYRGQAGASTILVGVAWSSNNPFSGRSKSVALSDMAPLLALPGLYPVSLQYGNAVTDIATLKAQAGIDVYADPDVDPLRSIDAQAAQIAALDIVVTISTAAAHLAAALGVPTLLLLPEQRGQLWYWGQAGERTPWYSSVRICRGEPGDDIGALIVRARRMLGGMLGGIAA